MLVQAYFASNPSDTFGYVKNRLELQTVQAEREREQLAARHAADAVELREMLTAREAEMLRSAGEARYVAIAVWYSRVRFLLIRVICFPFCEQPYRARAAAFPVVHFTRAFIRTSGSRWSDASVTKSRSPYAHETIFAFAFLVCECHSM